MIVDDGLPTANRIQEGSSKGRSAGTEKISTTGAVSQMNGYGRRAQDVVLMLTARNDLDRHAQFAGRSRQRADAPARAAVV